MQLYNRGIRRRLAPMLGNDRRRLELAFSLLFALPGTPMIQYGDEIGIGEDLSLREREAARTPMQWSDQPHGGFSKSESVFRPVVSNEEFGYQRVNAAAQQRDRDSLLNFVERMIRIRQQCQGIGWGDDKVIPLDAQGVLALHYEWRDTSLITLHNFSAEPRRVRIRLGDERRPLVSVLRIEQVAAAADGTYEVALNPYGYEWYRVGCADTALDQR
jgi:maltose alpha-D-glucosyltransferase/alpha-amylase